MITELSVLDNVWQLQGRNIILYGASGGGEKTFQILRDAGIDIFCFCDGDISKVGKTVCDKDVISKKTLKTYADDKGLNPCVIISSSFGIEIMKELQECNIHCDICSRWAVLWGLYFSMQREENVPDGAKEYWRKKKLFLAIHEITSNSLSSTISGLNTFQLRNILFEKRPIIVFSPAKVGSLSICASLSEIGEKNIIHLHDLDLWFTKEHYATAEQIELIQASFKHIHKLKIISGVRDPIGRDLALLFELMADGMYYSNDLNNECDFEEFVIKILLNETPLVKKSRRININAWPDYLHDKSKYGAVFDWFNLEMRRFFGVDIYDETFDREKGFTIIKKDNVEIFLYKLEKINQIEKELASFLEIPDFSLRYVNDSKDKSYYLTYNYIRENIKLPREYIDFYYKNNPCMKHFYSDEEIEQFYAKWIK